MNSIIRVFKIECKSTLFFLAKKAIFDVFIINFGLVTFPVFNGKDLPI
jgi:hypothetical protein